MIQLKESISNREIIFSLNIDAKSRKSRSISNTDLSLRILTKEEKRKKIKSAIGVI